MNRLAGGRLDVFAAAVGLVVSLALFSIGLFATDILVYGVPASLSLGCLLYLLSTRVAAAQWTPSVGTGAAELWESGLSRAAPPLVVVGTSGLVAIAVGTGGRPVYFLALAGAVGSLVIAQIVFSDLDRLDERVVLVEIVGLALVVRYAALLTTPGFVGIDNWTHVTSYAAAVQESGSLSALSGIKYLTAPFYHLLTVATAELLGVSLRAGLYLSVAAALPLSVLFVYAAARYVTGVRWALLAAAVFALSDYFTYWGLYVSTNSLGLAFFLAALLFLVRVLYVRVGRRDHAVLAAAAVAIALTHHVSAFIALVLLGTTVVVVALSRFVDEMTFPNDARYLSAVVGFFVAFTVVQWAVTPWMEEPFLLRAVGFVRQSVFESGGFGNLVEETRVEGQSDGGLARLATYVDSVGFFLFLIAATLGGLSMLRRSRSIGTYALVGTISVMMVFLLGLPLFGVRFLVPERWYVFVYALLAVVAAVGIGDFLNRVPRRGATAAILVFLVLFPGAMVAAQPATLDDPTFDRQWPTWAHTEPEIAAGETFAGTVPESDEPMYTDSPYFRTLVRIDQDVSERAAADYAPSRHVDMFTVTEAGRVDPEQEPVVYRTYQSERYASFLGPDGALISRTLPAERVCPETRNHVYATRGVRMCTRR